MPDAIDALRLFNEKARRLEGLSFTKMIFEQPSGINIAARLGEAVKVERTGPGDESVDAFVLTLRFFVQDNEPCSFRNMSKIYESLKIPEQKKKAFEYARNFVNNHLDKKSSYTINNVELTRRNIFETFMYGGLSHANPDKKQEYNGWMENPILGPLLQNEFIFTLGNLLNAIFYVERLNEEVMKELKDKDQSA